MKTYLLILFLSLLAASAAMAEVAETEIFNCTSEVQGFENFRIWQNVEVNAEQTKVTYQLKTGMLFFEDIWEQVGEALVSSESPVFASEFYRKFNTPILPIPGLDDPVEPVSESYIFVSINRTGSGSLSVNSDLAPIKCQKSF